MLTEQLGQSFIVESRPGAASNLATEAVTRFRLGGKAGTRNNAPVVDIPGAQFRFAKADTPQARTLGRVLDHIGFDVKDLKAFITKIEGEGIKLDEPYRKGAAGNAITYITDPWGARIELVERAPLL